MLVFWQSFLRFLRSFFWSYNIPTWWKKYIIPKHQFDFIRHHIDSLKSYIKILKRNNFVQLHIWTTVIWTWRKLLISCGILDCYIKLKLSYPIPIFKFWNLICHIIECFKLNIKYSIKSAIPQVSVLRTNFVSTVYVRLAYYI